jgi:predicted DCC family thiol-disulfide oxidoreductase YuxK
MIPIDMARDATAWLVLYDADCGVCRWSLGWVLRADRDHRLQPVALQSPEAGRLLAEVTEEQRMRSWHLVAPDGRRWSAGAAAPPLLRLLPHGTVAGAGRGAAPALTERVYRWVADNRSAIGRAIPAAARRRADRVIADRGG